MIPRYSRPEMAQIWSDQKKYLIWLKVELAVCEGLADEGVIPEKIWKSLKKKCDRLIKAGGVKPERVDVLESELKHDVIAFTTAVAEKIGKESRYIHFGLTSSDVVDTALTLQVQEAGEILLKDVDRLIGVLKEKAKQYQATPTIGRSHGIFAEPTAFGLKFLGWEMEWRRNRGRLIDALEQMRFGKLSGAVGVNAHLTPAFEQKVLNKLNLQREPVSTQVIPRDRHAFLMSVFALCGSSLERIAIELRHLQRSEVGEVMEGFQKGQKGSSAMPHKRNPISSENLTGAARILRAYAGAAFEDVALWHERDISHSSVERIIFPDATQLLNYALNRMVGVLERLEVREEQIKENLEKASTGSFSGHVLLELVRSGAPREKAYYWVQRCAHSALDGDAEDFIQKLSKHREIKRLLTEEKVRELCQVKYQLRNVGEIFRMTQEKQIERKSKNKRIR